MSFGSRPFDLQWYGTGIARWTFLGYATGPGDVTVLVSIPASWWLEEWAVKFSPALSLRYIDTWPYER